MTKTKAMSEIIISKEPLKKAAMVDIPAKYIADFFLTKEVVDKYGSIESFVFQDTIGLKRIVEPIDRIFFYDKKDLA